MPDPFAPIIWRPPPLPEVPASSLNKDYALVVLEACGPLSRYVQEAHPREDDDGNWRWFCVDGAPAVELSAWAWLRRPDDA